MDKIRLMMYERKETQATMAEKLGISDLTFNHKVNSKRPFSIKEIKKLVKIFGLTQGQVIEIFFKNTAWGNNNNDNQD